MQVLLSPSKTLDETSPIKPQKFTQPALLTETEVLANVLKAKKEGDIQSLMKLSDKLTDLNYERYQSFQTPFTTENARPAIFTFKGDVYDSMDVTGYSDEELAFAQKNIRILSGLYGILKPLDLMQPYRLEMGTKLDNERGKNLYAFWGDLITQQINKDGGTIVNLASNEYFKAIKPKELRGNLLTIHFKEDKGGNLKTIGLMAKRARGAMANYIIKNRVLDVEELKKFRESGYQFQPSLEKEGDWTFIAKR